MRGQPNRWSMWFPLVFLLIAALACGGFQARATPTTPASGGTPGTNAVAMAVATASTTAIPTAGNAEPPTATPSPTATEVVGLAKGKSARVVASGGLNVRGEAAASAALQGKLNPGVVVSVADGPVSGDNYTWWQIDDNSGLVGWVADGTETEPWLVEELGSGPASSGGTLVDRAVRLGDRVQVTTRDSRALTVRSAAGISATEMARLMPGTQLIVRGGPIRQDGLLWWQLEGETVNGWAADGEEGDRWLTPVE